MDVDVSPYRNVRGLIDFSAPQHKLTPLLFKNKHTVALIHWMAVSQRPIVVNFSPPTIRVEEDHRLESVTIWNGFPD